MIYSVAFVPFIDKHSELADGSWQNPSGVVAAEQVISADMENGGCEQNVYILISLNLVLIGANSSTLDQKSWILIEVRI